MSIASHLWAGGQGHGHLRVSGLRESGPGGAVEARGSS